jgi:hypothetical protein
LAKEKVTLFEWVQVGGILMEVIFIPLFWGIGRTLVTLHFDVRSLVRELQEIKIRMDKMESHEQRITRLEVQVESLHN